MAKKITRTKRINEEKERNCRRTIGEFLRLIGYQCPTTDPTTLRAEAERKLNKIKKRKLTHDQDSNSPVSVACEIKKVECDELITTSTSNTMDSRLMKGQSRFNHCGLECGKVKRYLKEIHGSDQMVELVFEKKLTASDVNPAQCRLLMPLKQVHRQDILKQIKGKKGVRLYVPPRQQHYDVCLTVWDMSTNQNYVLRTGWIKVVKDNKLEENMVVQLWSFQVGDDHIPSLLLLLGDIDGDSCACKCSLSSDEDESTPAIANVLYEEGECSRAVGYDDDDDDDDIYGYRRHDPGTYNRWDVIYKPR